MLVERQYHVYCLLPDFGGKLSEDCQTNLIRLKDQGIAEIKTIKTENDIPEIRANDVIVDGIFGSGLSRIVSGTAAGIIHRINVSGARVVSIDIPSGLFGEDNSENDYHSIVRADFTLTFQFPFLSFFFSENADYVGKWRVLDIHLHPEKIKNTRADYHTVHMEDVRKLLPLRRKFSHKGNYGHGLLICGSYGMMGAAVLAAKACLRGGAGLVTLHVPKSGYNIVQTAIPEAIVSLDQSDTMFTNQPDLKPFKVVGAGPGIGCRNETGNALKQLLKNVKVPMVIDADAINLLADHKDWHGLIPAGSILTPHPKEFDRLAGQSSNSYERHLRQIEFSRNYNVYIILKGAYTGISDPEGTYFFNTSGNPGMATGGSGDVLTGLIVALLAQDFSPREAALSAVYIHGLAGDLALEESSEEALIAGDIIDKLGLAFRKTKEIPILDPLKGRYVF